MASGRRAGSECCTQAIQVDPQCLWLDGFDALGGGSPLFPVCSGMRPPAPCGGGALRQGGWAWAGGCPHPAQAPLTTGGESSHLCFASLWSGWLPPLVPATSVSGFGSLPSDVTFGDLVSSLCPFHMQPEPLGGDASAQATVEKLQEENRQLKQKVTHVSAYSVSSGARALVPGRGGPWGAWGWPPPSVHFVDAQAP